MKVRQALFSVAITLSMISAETANAAAIFVDWTAVDATANTAGGTLGASTVSLTTTSAVPNANDANGGVHSGTTNGAFAGFSSPFFTPTVAATDGIFMGSSSSFMLAFSSPITNPTLHIYQLANTTLTFSAAFTLLSSDGDFTTMAGSVRGESDTDDANGSLLFTGSFSSLSWTASNSNSGDLMGIQLSIPDPAATPEPGSLALFCVALVGLGLKGRFPRKRFGR